MKPTTTKEIGKYRIKIFQDEAIESPREDDNLGTMICFHSRYNLGDKHNHSREEAQKLLKGKDICVSLHLYLYDHSGITMNTTGFSCGWDSGQVGFIYVTKQKVREEYNVKRITKNILEKVTNVLQGEVKTYDQYLTGDVYRYEIVEITKCDKGHEHEEDLDSCGGYYGDEICLQEAEGIVNHYLKKETEVV